MYLFIPDGLLWYLAGIISAMIVLYIIGVRVEKKTYNLLHKEEDK